MRKRLPGLLARIAISIAALLVVAIVALGLFLSRDKTLGERHAAIAMAEFNYANGTYADYISWSREILQRGRVGPAAPAVINNLAPFELIPGPECPRSADGKVAKGIVLIHGLIDSPYGMRHFGEQLQAQCFHVLALLLPDHGTRPGNFLGSTWQEWAEATHFATQQLALRADTLFISGHSAGGTLALLEAANNAAVDALILFAPALAITPSARYAQYVALLGKLFPKAAWFEVKPDEALYRYESFPFTGAAETYGLIMATNTALAQQQRQLPVFMVASQQDNTVSTPAILDYMRGNTHPLSRTLLYSQFDIAAPARTEVINSSAPDQGRLSLGHLGLMTPPDHPYYGRDGEYRNCGHYEPRSVEFIACKNGERAYYGEPTADNLQLGIVERIAFNPLYASMVKEIGNFAAAIME